MFCIKHSAIYQCSFLIIASQCLLLSASQTLSQNATILSAGVYKYVAIPTNPRKVSETEVAIKETISRDIQTIKSEYSRSRAAYGGIQLWSFDADETEISLLKTKIQHDAHKADVVPNRNAAIAQDFLAVPPIVRGNATTKSVDILGMIETDRKAPEDLKIISWAPGTKPPQHGWSFGYKFERSSKPTFIYVIENGVASSHRDFYYMSWFYGPQVRLGTSDDSLDSSGHNDWHGSCVASKAFGSFNGVARDSTAIILKASRALDDIVWAFSKALDHIVENDRQSKSVVVFASTSNNSESVSTARYPWPLVRSTMRDMFDADIAVIVPSGNFAQASSHDTHVDTYPALWESDSFPLIVAGAVNNVGQLAPFSQGPEHVTTWAPGVDVSCAKLDSVPKSGTSYSTGMVSDLVAGLVAYFLSLQTPPFTVKKGRTVYNIRNHLKSSGASWNRTYKGPRVVWNGLDGTNGLGGNVLHPWNITIA
ncbi:hypothetical protein ACLMJK_007584 [Lecanora helva]